MLWIPDPGIRGGVVIARLERWLLQAPGLRTATIVATEYTVPRQVVVRLMENGIVADVMAVSAETALARALDIAEGVS
jgi:hypothetical protein